MQNKLLILAALLFTGCGPDRVTEYSCRGTFVTRIDKGATSQFFYGTYAQTSGQPPVVEAHYPGFDGLMAAYLTFKGNHVELQPAGGYFERKMPHKNLSVMDRDNAVFPDWLDSIRSDMSHTVYLTNANSESEAMRNQQYRSGVKTTTVPVGFLSSL